jgi:hypothetical protein
MLPTALPVAISIKEHMGSASINKIS